jgi:hypothetical protein
MGGKPAHVDEKTFVDLFTTIGPRAMHRKYGWNERAIYTRRANLEVKLKRQITWEGGSDKLSNRTRVGAEHPGRVEYEVKDGVVLVGSDFHYWPGPPSTMHRAFVRMCKDLDPALVVLNGDIVDMAAVSRHAPIGWEKRPTVKEEIEAAQDRLHEIKEACGRGVPQVWCLGNHDGRFETRLATVAPEYAKIKGIHLYDHFPGFESAWSCWINDDVVIKHRFKGGIHATWNNTIYAGKTIVTGHLHSARITPFTNYNGTTYGIDTGCVADCFGPAFGYLEDNPRNWRSAFAVLTFRAGELLQPELCLKRDEGVAEFRGDLIKV